MLEGTRVKEMVEHLSVQYLYLCQDGWEIDKSHVFALSTELSHMDCAQQTHQIQETHTQLTNSACSVAGMQTSPEFLGEKCEL